MRHLSPAFALAVTLAALAAATPASAAGCQGDDCGTDPGPIDGPVIRNTLTVQSPQGTVTSSPAGIHCVANTDDCTQTVACDPAFETCDSSAWPTFALSASAGPPGYSPVWTGCNSVLGGACNVKLDDDKTVTLAWVDRTAPSVTLWIPGRTADGRVARSETVTATATDNASVARVEFLVDGVVRASDTIAPYGAMLDLSSYDDGEPHDITARAMDPSGNFAFVTREVTVDSTVSLTVGDIPPFTNSSTVPLTIASDPGATLSCALDAGPFGPCGASPYSPIGAGTPDGSYTYAVRATDDVGNVASATRSFVLDRTPPALAFSEGPTEGQIVGTPSVAISFSETEANRAGLECRLDSTAVSCSPGQPVQLEALTNGAHRFTVHATDRAGNGSNIGRNFAVTLPTTPGTGGPQAAAPLPSTAPGQRSAGGANQPEALRVKIRAKRQRALKRKRLVFTFLSNARFKATIKARLGRKLLARSTRRIRAGKHKVTLRLKKKARARLRRVLRKRKRVNVKLALTYTAAAGARSSARKRIVVRR